MYIRCLGSSNKIIKVIRIGLDHQRVKLSQNRNFLTIETFQNGNLLKMEIFLKWKPAKNRNFPKTKTY